MISCRDGRAAAAPPPRVADDEWVALGRVVKTQGRRGELAVEPQTDIPGRFDQLEGVWLRAAGASPASPARFRLLRHWPHQGRQVLALEGIEDLTAAERWVGAAVLLPAAERAPAPAGSYFFSDLEGCAVFDRGQRVGEVTAVEAVAGAPHLLHVTRAGGQPEALIPFAADYITAVSLAGRRLDLQLPAGLLEL
ncbi:MAG: ribosome maturation factor RimM [Terriglobales bacterium]